MKPTLKLVDGVKQFRSEEFNWNFNMQNGYTETWGKTVEENPDYSPYGPMIADIEIDEVCNGIPDKNGVFQPCPFCYKANVGYKGNTMNFESFKSMIDKFPKYNGLHYLNQVALGISDVDHNKDLFKIMGYCREIGIVPNLTINGARLTNEIINNLVKFSGAISVSCYERNPDICYDAIKLLTDAGLKQCNIHITYFDTNVDFVKSVIKTVSTDDRLKKLQAVVLLALKQKGRGLTYNPVSDEQFHDIVSYAFNMNVGLGFDSCSAPRVIRIFKQMGIFEKYEHLIEPCESGILSSYVNVDNVYFPCSFCEDSEEGIDINNIENFIDGVWLNPLTEQWRIKLLKCKRECPVYNV